MKRISLNCTGSKPLLLDGSEQEEACVFPLQSSAWCLGENENAVRELKDIQISHSEAGSELGSSILKSFFTRSLHTVYFLLFLLISSTACGKPTEMIVWDCEDTQRDTRCPWKMGSKNTIILAWPACCISMWLPCWWRSYSLFSMWPCFLPGNWLSAGVTAQKLQRRMGSLAED